MSVISIEKDRYDEVLKHITYNPVPENISQPFVWANQLSPKAPIGSRVGCLRKSGYWRIGIGGQGLALHRLVMYYHGFDIFNKEYVVDHMNGNPSDNRIENLRLVSRVENSRNSSKPSNNTSGKTRLDLVTDTRWSVPYFYWRVRWFDKDGVRRHKKFSCLKHGDEGAKQMAIDYLELEFNSRPSEFGYLIEQRNDF